MAVGISLRLADHHSEHADSLSGPPGDCENSVYKAREGERSESEEEVISSCFIEEKGVKMRAAHTIPSYKTIHGVLNYNIVYTYFLFTFHSSRMCGGVHYPVFDQHTPCSNMYLSYHGHIRGHSN